MNSIKKNLLYNSIYQILLFLIPIITAPYISRVLGTRGIGLYSFNNSIAYYFVIFTMLGLNNYGNREVARTRDDKKKLSKSFFSIYGLQFICGIITNILYLLYSFFITNNLILSISLYPLVLAAMFDINWFYFGVENFRFTIIRNVIIKILTTISIFVFVNDMNDVAVYCLILSIGMLLSNLSLWTLLGKYVDIYIPRWEEIRIHIRPNLLLFVTVISVSLFKIMDKIMLGVITTSNEVGLYESAEKIIAIPTAFVLSLGTVMLPRMSNVIAKNDKSRSLELIENSIIFAIFLSTSLGFGIMGISKEFVPIFFGDGFEKCIYLLWILLPSSIFIAFANVIRTQYLLPIGDDKTYVISSIIGAIINLIINYILIPKLGSIGAAIGTLVSEASVCFYQTINTKHVLPIKGYITDSIVFLVGGIVMFCLLIKLNFDIAIQLLMISKVIIGVFVYIILVLILLLLFNKKILNRFMNLLLKKQYNKSKKP
ncbi:flippase [Anaerococcus tetradius]|uniref:flippase n=1 Tax=Anaerococcus tetradius TaxID=33036 RepID=UPI0023F427B5|nr:flippase [Anaerococcus tetradius]